MEALLLKVMNDTMTTIGPPRAGSLAKGSERYHNTGQPPITKGNEWYHNTGQPPIAKGNEWYHNTGQPPIAKGNEWYHSRGQPPITKGNEWYHNTGQPHITKGNEWYHTTGQPPIAKGDHVALRPQKRRGRKSEGSTADTARKRPERPRTAARTMEVLRRCPLAIAQRLVHYAIAVSTAVLGRVAKTMSVAPLLRNNRKRKKSNFRSPAPPPCS